MFSPPGGPNLEESDVVPRDDSAAISSPLADTIEERPALTSDRNNLASPARAVKTAACRSVGKDDLVVTFLRGARRLNPSHPHSVPTWDLSIVLRALQGPLFEPLQ